MMDSVIGASEGNRHEHLKKKHKGRIMRNSQLNRPFWLDWIQFKSEAIEEEFNFSLSELESFK